MPLSPKKSEPAKKVLTTSIFRVNLLVQKGIQPKLYLKILNWVLSSGRFIVIFVEIVVIIAVVYKYKLDTEYASLQDKIQQQIPYIQSLKNDELLIRQTQYQLSMIKQNKSANPDFSQVVFLIAALTPQSIKLSNITFDRTQSYPNTNLTITGESPSVIQISAFIKALKKDPTFADIALTNLSLEGETTFSIIGVILK